MSYIGINNYLLKGAVACMTALCIATNGVSFEYKNPEQQEPLISSYSEKKETETKKPEIKTNEGIWYKELNTGMGAELESFVFEKSKEYDVDPYVVFAVMEKESNFKLNVVGYNQNGTKNYGPMQINSCNVSWLKKLGFDVVGSTKDNIASGIYILKANLDKADGNYPLALTGYNTGSPTRVNNYALSVMKRADEIREIARISDIELFYNIAKNETKA